MSRPRHVITAIGCDPQHGDLSGWAFDGADSTAPGVEYHVDGSPPLAGGYTLAELRDIWLEHQAAEKADRDRDHLNAETDRDRVEEAEA